MTTDRHRDPPYRFRPTRENRKWLQAQQDAGHAVNALVNAALNAYRNTIPEGEQK